MTRACATILPKRRVRPDGFVTSSTSQESKISADPRVANLIQRQSFSAMKVLRHPRRQHLPPRPQEYVSRRDHLPPLKSDILPRRLPLSQERILTCLVHNTAVPGSRRSTGKLSGPQTSIPGGLHDHINELKSIVDKQRAEVPALVMKQTTAHLEALQPIEGSLSQISDLRRDGAVASRIGGRAGAIDVQQDLLERCEVLPELQRRLQTATAKLGTILSQIDASAKLRA